MHFQKRGIGLGALALIVFLQSPTSPSLPELSSSSKPLTSPSAVTAGWRSDEAPRAKVIYGNDDRVEIEDATDANQLKLARSVAAQVANRDIRSSEIAGWSRVQAAPYGFVYNLCRDERFYDQPSAADCTAFLIAPDIIATAGHCVTSLNQCRKNSWIFSFEIDGTGREPTLVRDSDIYTCADLITTQVQSNGLDYALVRLDRVVPDRAPLALRGFGRLNNGDGVFVIGHPAGLPKKIAGGARVRNNSAPGWFTAELDTYGGNSGSPVFNASTHDVEGILVRGETDFEYANGMCMRSKRCPSGSCAGEDVVRISEVLSSLPTR